MAYDTIVSFVERITAKVDGVSLPVHTATWSEDRNVTVWWAVIPADAVEEDDVNNLDLTIHYADGTTDKD